VCVCVGLPTNGGGRGTLLGSVFSQADWVVANSQAMLDDVAQLDPTSTVRSSVIHEARRAPDEPPAPLPFDPPVVLGYGRVERDKGFDVAIAGFARARGEVPEARMVIAGDGSARPGLEAQARELGVEEAVEFRGWVAPERVPQLINQATVVVVPSRWREAFGLVAVEAALMERPVLATRVGGLEEVVADGETGVLVRNEDDRALARALVGLLRDRERASAMGRAGRGRALRKFDFDAHVEAYERLYARLAA
jgi:glycogen(starch) synthase